MIKLMEHKVSEFGRLKGRAQWHQKRENESGPKTSSKNLIFPPQREFKQRIYATRILSTMFLTTERQIGSLIRES